jgi:hypothetical protein
LGEERASADSSFCIDAKHNPRIDRGSKETVGKKRLAPAVVVWIRRIWSSFLENEFKENFEQNQF